MAGGRPHTSGALTVGGTSRVGMRSQAVLAQPSQKGPGWAAALDPRRLPKLPGADIAANGLALSSLVDDFQDGVVDPSLWPDSFGTYSEVGGRARVQCDTGYNAYSSALAYRLAESQMSLRVYPPAAGGASTEAWTQVLIKEQTNGTDLGFEVNPLFGLLKMFSRTGFFDAGEVDITYDPVAHAWLRVRETGGNTYWETSPEGLFWTTRRTLTSPAWVGEPNLEFQLIAHRSDGTVDFAEFDNLNVTHIRDDFDSYSTGTTWAEGSTNGPWLVKFLGLAGQVIPVDVVGEGRTLQLEAVDQASTSSSLVVSTPRTVNDVHWRTRCRTVAQLHTTPNPWEVIWFVWNYDEPAPGMRRFYYISLKTSGFELGKVDQSIGLSGGQRFLWTDSTAFTIGQWYNVEVKQVGAEIKVWVDGVLRADFTDGPGSSGTPGWGTAGEIVMTAGSVGMYHEDARVQFGNILWVDELVADAALTATASLTAAAANATSISGSLTATATLTATGTVAAVGAATTTTTAAIAAAGTRNTNADASTTPTATLTAAGTLNAAGTATAAVTATATAAGQTSAVAGAATTTTAALTGSGLIAAVGTATAAPTASLTAAGAIAAAGAAALTGTATITATATRGTTADATLATTASLTADGTVSSASSGTATATLTATVSGAGVVAVAAVAALPVGATLTADAVRGASSTADVAATGTLTAQGATGTTSTAALAATAALDAAGQYAANIAGDFTVAASITADGTVAVVHDDIDVAVGIPYSPWAVGGPQGASWPAGQPQDSDWEVAAPW